MYPLEDYNGAFFALKMLIYVLTWHPLGSEAPPKTLGPPLNLGPPLFGIRQVPP